MPRRKKNAELSLHGTDTRAAAAAISDLARLHADPKYGSQQEDFNDLAVALDMAQQGQPVLDGEETYKAARDYADAKGRRHYYATVEAIADEILSELSGDYSREEAEDVLVERVSEAVDGNWWIIYPHNAILVTQYSDNSDAYADQGMELSSDDLNQAITMAAFFAMETDVQEAIDKRIENVVWTQSRMLKTKKKPKLKAKLLR